MTPRDTHLRARIRVIIDNDFSGDPDGLVQLAHQVLSRTTEVRLVVGSHLPVGHAFTTSRTTADDAAAKAAELLELTGEAGHSVPVVAGSNQPVVDSPTLVASPAASMIVVEAMRESTLPLYVVCGASLSEIASAYLLEPAIAERLTVVWIGGPEYPETGSPAWPDDEIEYNMSGDITAAQIVFGSELRLWQIPRNAYRQVMVSLDAVRLRLQPSGALGAYLYSSLAAIVDEVRGFGLEMGETFCLGDSALVLLTSLQSGFNPDGASSEYRLLPAPRIGADGRYVANPAGRPIRVYTRLDSYLLIEDLYAKVARLAELA